MEKLFTFEKISENEVKRVETTTIGNNTSITETINNIDDQISILESQKQYLQDIINNSELEVQKINENIQKIKGL